MNDKIWFVVIVATIIAGCGFSFVNIALSNIARDQINGRGPAGSILRFLILSSVGFVSMAAAGFIAYMGLTQ